MQPTTKKDIVCIVCPMGCKIEATIMGEQVERVENAVCKRGIEFAKEEIENPTRTLTSTVKLVLDNLTRLPVRTANPVPKQKLSACMQAINQVIIQAPVTLGDVILSDLAGTGVNLIATRSIPA